MKARPNVDYEGFRQDLLAALKAAIPEYTDFSQSDAGVVLLELLAHGLDILSFYNDKVANEMFLETARERGSVVHLCRLIGYELGSAVPAKYSQVFEITPQDTDFVVPAGLQVTTKDGEVFETEKALVIPAGKTGLEKDENNVYLYQTTVAHGYMVSEDVLGSSDGTRWQRFKLNYAPVSVEDLVVQVNEGAGFEEWTRVLNFVDSDANSKVYRVFVEDDDSLYIEFGSGNAGKIPAVVTNGIMASYRVGGGTGGNVAVGTITEITSPLAGMLSTMNIEQIQAGQDKESIEDAKVRAQAALRTLDRAVTAKDYKDLALTNKKVALSGVHVETVNGIVGITVYVLPKGMSTLPDDLKAELQDFYDNRKELGRDVIIRGPTLVPLDVDLTVQAYSTFKHSTLRTAVTDAVQAFFALGQRPFGETPAQSEIIAEIMDITGVRACDVAISGGAITEGCIATLGTLAITLTGGINDE